MTKPRIRLLLLAGLAGPAAFAADSSLPPIFAPGTGSEAGAPAPTAVLVSPRAGSPTIEISESAEPARQLFGAAGSSDRLDLLSNAFTAKEIAAATLASNLAAATRAGLRANPGATSASAYSGAISTALVYGGGPNASGWPALTSWAAGPQNFRRMFRSEALPATLDFTRRNPFYDSAGKFGTADLVQKAAVLLPMPRVGGGWIGANLLRFSVLEWKAGDAYHPAPAAGDFGDFARYWLKRTANLAMAAGLAPLLSRNSVSAASPKAEPAGRVARSRAQFPVTVCYFY